MKIKAVKREVYPGDKYRFLGDVLSKQLALQTQIESRAGTLLSFAVGILVFVFAQRQIVTAYPIEFVLLIGTLLLTIFHSLLVLKPPKLFSKRGQVESLLYHTSIGKYSADEYVAVAEKICADESATVKEYAKEIYNITKYSLLYKKAHANWAVRLFAYGTILTVLIAFVRAGLIWIGA